MENKVGVVTGAAGGIGAAVARELAEGGAVVAALDSDSVALREAVAKMVADGLRVVAFPVDVTSSREVENVIDAVEVGLGPVEFLVNVAGVLRMAEARAVTDKDWADTFAVNTTGVFHMSRAVVNRMVPRARGAVVTVASNAASTPRMFMAAYASSKAATTMYTKCLGLEVARHGIRCNVVAPGSTDTTMLRAMWHDQTGMQSTVDGSLETFKPGIPLGKLGRAADVAHAVTFLLSDRAGHITMHELTVDGGATLGA
ncbi:MAG: 2,3-dihydro-2,3-dihydroxybenzoate dehydrogenase [Actinomycetota bacterium]|nr:2,3-dihydro-2,3-dihydroxybenzoate dehydrogenase [Actinomycetota bacterium]